MEYRNHKDLSLSEIGVGCYALSGVYGPKDVDHFQAMLRRAFQLGVNFFDVADGYGEAESVLGETVQPFRQDIYIATKVGIRDGMEPNLSAAYIEKACEQSLNNLKTDHIDLYQVHFDDPDTHVVETVAALEKLVKDGKIRHYGVCHLPFGRVEQYMQLGDPFSVLMELSAVTRDSMGKLLPLCWKYAVGGIAFSTTGRGILAGCFTSETVFPPDDLRSLDPLFQRERFLSGLRVADKLARLGRNYDLTPAQMAIAWVLAQSGIVCALTGPSTIDHLEENLEASGVQFAAADWLDFEEFLDRESGNLSQIQCESIQQILSNPIAPELATAFVDLVYVLETSIQLGLLPEEEGMPIFQHLFQLRGKEDQNSKPQFQAIQTQLLDILEHKI